MILLNAFLVELIFGSILLIVAAILSPLIIPVYKRIRNKMTGSFLDSKSSRASMNVMDVVSVCLVIIAFLFVVCLLTMLVFMEFMTAF